jgi:hypothetical protein
MDGNKEDKKYFGLIFEQLKTSFDRCFWPERKCSSKSIRAHSIQNSFVLDLLCENDHLIMLNGGIDIEKGAFFKFEKIGRNKATTFNGLCNKHDNKLFEPIDKNIFSHNNIKGLFLIAYRSVLRELHAKMRAAVDIQSIYKKGVELGKFNPEVQDWPMMMTTVAMAEAYTFYLYKFQYDKIYSKNIFEEIEHKVDYIEDIEPSIAVSSVYSYIDNMRLFNDRKDPKCIVLNVFPHYNGMYVIFSFIKRHREYLMPHINEFDKQEKHYKLYLLSKIILMNCENFVLAPKFYKILSEERLESIKTYFMKNMYGNKIDYEDKNLYLFY